MVVTERAPAMPKRSFHGETYSGILLLLIKVWDLHINIKLMMSMRSFLSINVIN